MEDDILYNIIVFLVLSFILFAIVFYIIKCCQVCCRINYKFIVEGKYENEPTVLEESNPQLMLELSEQPEDDTDFMQSLPQELLLITPTSPSNRQFIPSGSSHYSSLTTVPRLSAFHEASNSFHHMDDPPSYEDAMRMSSNLTRNLEDRGN